MTPVTWLDLRLAVARQPALAALLLAVAMLILILLTHPPRESVDVSASEYEVARVLAAQRNFQASLIAAESVASAQQAVLDAASAHGLRVGAVEYTQENDPAGAFAIAAMQLPVSGAYPEIRQFIDEALRTQPAMSIRHLRIEREGGEETALLRATLGIQFLIREKSQ